MFGGEVRHAHFDRVAMPDITIIIPTRNRPDLLVGALSSVVRQTGPLTRECIVVDDGDPARSAGIREAVGNENARYLATGGNRGGSFARNLGIEKARGALVAFLDDDDVWEPEKLAAQSAFMADRSIAMSYTGATVVSGKGGRRYTFREPREKDQYRAIMRKNFVGSTSTVMVRREALQEIGGFDTALPALQDYDLCIRLLRQYRTGWLPQALTIYHDDDTAGDKVSGSRRRFIEARGYLIRKYRDDPYATMLQNTLQRIEILKCIRSRRFLFATLREIMRGKE
jgi:glycosyltransferase involved in cell wall biosynthesis